KSLLSSFIILPGTPTTVHPSGMSLFITEPAPTTTPLPTVIFGRIVQLVPKNVNSPILQFPEIAEPGQTSTKSSIKTSWPIEAIWLTKTPFPSLTSLVITEFNIMFDAAPISTPNDPILLVEDII